MTRSAILLAFIWACSGTRARAPAAPIQGEMYVDKIPYNLCGMLLISAQDPKLVEASQHFSRAANRPAGLEREAGADYLSGASVLRQSEVRADAEVVANRRVAYANGINLWLSLGLVDDARRALSLAAIEDAELAGVLREAADRLPAPMNC